MKELTTIIKTFESIDFTHQKAALATVVKIQGSSYRQPGARMLILEDGHWEGAISGGCLEGDALRKAREVMRSGAPRHITYDTRKDKPADHIPFSMGCEGVIDVLIEPLIHDKGNFHPITIFKEFIQSNRKHLLVTMYHVTHESMGVAGERLHIDHKGQIRDNFSNEKLSKLVSDEAENMIHWNQSFQKDIRVDNHQASLFYEILVPPIHLMIFGGGYDVIPVVNLAKNLGWHVTVADECIAKTFPQKFPSADQVLNIPGEDVYRETRELNASYALVMSHNFKYDREVLKGLGKSDIPYIGLLGPKKRMKTMVEELKKSHKEPLEDLNKKIFAPVGLNIGAETPDEIALSIISEILAFHNGKEAGFLKDKKGHIHDRDTALQTV